MREGIGFMWKMTLQFAIESEIIIKNYKNFCCWNVGSVGIYYICNLISGRPGVNKFWQGHGTSNVHVQIKSIVDFQTCVVIPQIYVKTAIDNIFWSQIYIWSILNFNRRDRSGTAPRIGSEWNL